MIDNFAQTEYKFLEIDNGLVKNEYTAYGVFKERTGISNDGRHESHDVSSTLHIYPNEPFISDYIKLEGHEILIGLNTYRIDGVTNGTDLTGDGASEFYRLTLTKKDARWHSDLPVS